MIHLNLRSKFHHWTVNNLIGRWLFFGGTANLYNRFITNKIIYDFDGYWGHLANPKTGNLGFGFIHYSLIINTKAKRVLVVGSRRGYIPLICAIACKDARYGHVDFVDAGYGDDHKNAWSGVGIWKKIDLSNYFSFFGADKYITTHVMTTNEFIKRNPKIKYDYIYIDGDHSYKGVHNDWKLLWPKLNKYGFMVFHDTKVQYTKSLGNFGVWKLWKKISKKNAIEFPYPADSGLGILQKR